MFTATNHQFQEENIGLTSSYEHTLDYQNFPDALQLAFSSDTIENVHGHEQLVAEQFGFTKKENYFNYNNTETLNLNYEDIIQENYGHEQYFSAGSDYSALSTRHGHMNFC